MKLGKLRIGKVDGKHEYLTPVSKREKDLFDAFLVPEVVDPTRMHNGDIFFIEGFRGTGKTSLLRWHAEQHRINGAVTDFVLFKTDLSETERLHVSKEVGISWTDLDPANMEVAQDFKAAWTWFILHKIGENLKEDSKLYQDSSRSHAEKFIRLLGLNDDSVLKKAIGFMPKLDGATVKIRADAGFFEAELGGDFKKEGDSGRVTLDALSRRTLHALKAISFERPLYIYFDELEAFYHTPEQHRRDQRMVRDLLFSAANMNEGLRKAAVPVHILAAVRSEVIDSMGSLGQEVDRLVHDRGFHISWHHAKRSLHHPLIQIIRRKILASERVEGQEQAYDPIEKYFPKKVNEEVIEAFLLDRSFYKPRDIIWRLSIAQKLFPAEEKFSVEVLLNTETEYSSKLWDEVRYELSATYSDLEIDAIESVLCGGSSAFQLEEIEGRFDRAAQLAPTLRILLQKKPVRDILHDLYRLGAVGNSFRVGPSGTNIQNRWSFRGDPALVPEKRMVIHHALLKRLSAVSARRRGKRAGR